MSERQVLRRVCDGCRLQHDYDVQGPAGLRPEEEKSFTQWITVARGFIVNQQLVPIVKHACSAPCAISVIQKGLEMPKHQSASFSESSGPIDMAKVQRAAADEKLN